MRRLRLALVTLLAVFGLFSFVPAAAESCAGGNPNADAGAFSIFPRWYQYLELDENCNIEDFRAGDVGLVGIAILEILLRLAGLVAFIYIIIAGFKYVLSRGNSSEAAKARQTVIDAAIGLAIAIIAAALVGFIGRTLAR